MDYRRDVLPPVLGLGISLLVHGLLLLTRADLFDRSEIPAVETVVVELFSTPSDTDGEPSAKAASASAQPAPTPDPPRRKKRSPPQESSQQRNGAKATPPPQESFPPHPADAITEPGPSSENPTADRSLPALPPPEVHEATPASTPRSLPSVAELMPRPAELARITERSEVPDPTAAGEATLALGETDERYRRYLDLVQSSIDVTWQWKEALLACGRGGTVLVRFTLRPDGEVEEVEVQEGCGSPLLEEEAMKAVRDAKIPAFPNHWRIGRLHLFAQFDYQFE